MLQPENAVCFRGHGRFFYKAKDKVMEMPAGGMALGMMRIYLLF